MLKRIKKDALNNASTFWCTGHVTVDGVLLHVEQRDLDKELYTVEETVQVIRALENSLEEVSEARALFDLMIEHLGNNSEISIHSDWGDLDQRTVDSLQIVAEKLLSMARAAKQ